MRDMGLITNAEPGSQVVHAGHGGGEWRKMSKSKATWWTPQVGEQHGADTARMFALFAAPPSAIWLDRSRRGRNLFVSLGRVTVLYPQHRGGGRAMVLPTAKVLRKMHPGVAEDHAGFRPPLAFHHVEIAAMDWNW